MHYANLRNGVLGQRVALTPLQQIIADGGTVWIDPSSGASWADTTGTVTLAQSDPAQRPAVAGGGLVFDGTNDCLYVDASRAYGCVGLAVNWGDAAATFPDFSSLLSGDGTGSELLIGSSGAADWFAGLFGNSGTTLLDGSSTVTFLPRESISRLISWTASPETHARLTLGCGRTGYPGAPASRAWNGTVKALVTYPTDPGAAARARLDSFLALYQ